MTRKKAHKMSKKNTKLAKTHLFTQIINNSDRPGHMQKQINRQKIRKVHTINRIIANRLVGHQRAGNHEDERLCEKLQ